MSDHIDQLPFNISDPMVVIAPRNADQAFAAGVRFARAMVLSGLAPVGAIWLDRQRSRRVYLRVADWMDEMNCVCCGSKAVAERPEVTAQGYRRFRCRDCGRQFNERSGGVLNRTSLPSDVIAFVVFCRLRYRLTLRDLSEILLLRGIDVSHEAVRDWETKLLPIMGEELRKRPHGKRRGPGASWYVTRPT